MKSRKEIIFIIPHLGKGGAENIIINICNSLINKFKIKLIVLQNIKEAKENYLKLNKEVNLEFIFKKEVKFMERNSKIIRVFSYILSPLFALYIFFKYRIYKANIVHLNLTFSRIVGPWLKIFSLISLRKIYFIETFHSNWKLLTFIQKVICSINWSFMNLVIAEIGNSEEKNIKKYSFCNKTYFIPFAVKIEETNKKIVKSYNKIINTNEKKTLTIVTISRLINKIKRFDIIFDALYILKKKNIEFKYLLFGDGPDKNFLEELVRRKNLQESVVFFGYVDDPSSIVTLGDVYLTTMVDDFMGIAGLQAVSKNIPVIGVQTNPDYKENQSFSSNSPAILSEKLIDFMNEEFKIKFIQSELKRIQSKHDFSKFIERYQNLFLEISD